jgi:glycosyltransferase involved in cell wall biosynthesis
MTKNSLKISVIEPRGSGGMIHYAYQLCNALSDCGMDVTLVTSTNYEMENYPHKFHVKKLMNLWGRDNPSSGSSPLSQVHTRATKMYRSLRRIYRGVKLFLQWIKLTYYLLVQKPDVIQFGEIEFPFEALFLRFLKFRGLTLSQICHEFEPRERERGFQVLINNLLLGNVFGAFSIMFFHSESNIKRFQELYPGVTDAHIVVIPMGTGQVFPLSEESPFIQKRLLQAYGLDDGESIVLFFGNITPSKGVPDLLRAFEKVYSKNTNIRLVIAGMPLKYMDINELTELASSLGIRNVTKFDARYLPMEEVGPLIQMSKVVVFPYINSTQSASVQAAYAFGRPVVATRVGGLPDVVEDGRSGFLVEPNSPDEIALAISKIVDDPALARKMGTYAKELSEVRFAWGPIARKISDVYYNHFTGAHG